MSEDEVNSKISRFSDWFNVSAECSSENITQAALTSVALDRMAEIFRLGALAYYYEGEGDPDY